jgi:hypothetical protein
MFRDQTFQMLPAIIIGIYSTVFYYFSLSASFPNYNSSLVLFRSAFNSMISSSFSKSCSRQWANSLVNVCTSYPERNCAWKMPFVLDFLFLPLVNHSWLFPAVFSMIPFPDPRLDTFLPLLLSDVASEPT